MLIFLQSTAVQSRCLLPGDLDPSEGELRKSYKLRIGRYAQHFVDALQMTDTPVEYLLKKQVQLFPENPEMHVKPEDIRWVGLRGGCARAAHTRMVWAVRFGTSVRSWCAPSELPCMPCNGPECCSCQRMAHNFVLWVLLTLSRRLRWAAEGLVGQPGRVVAAGHPQLRVVFACCTVRSNCLCSLVATPGRMLASHHAWQVPSCVRQAVGQCQSRATGSRV